MRNKLLAVAAAAGLMLGATFCYASARVSAQVSAQDGTPASTQVNDGNTTAKAEFNFSQKQIEIIRRYARGRLVKPADVELEIGEILPDDMEFHSLPEKIERHVPALRGYRYFVIEDEIVLVDPLENRIVEILDD